MIIPGLLQTEAYARAIIGCSPRLAPQVDDSTARRLARQAAVLERPEPATLSAIIGEAALRHGDAELMRPQLAHLIDMGRRLTVHVRVIPMSAGLHAGLAGAFAIASLPAGHPTAYLDDQLRGRVVTDAGEVGELGQVWEALCERALPADQSRDLISKVINDAHHD